MQEPMEYVGEKPTDKITLDVFPGANHSFNLYEDDGTSLDYQDGEYAQTKIDLVSSSASLKILIAKPDGKFQTALHHFLLKIHSDRRPTNVFENGQLINETRSNSEGWVYDSKQKIIWVTPHLQQGVSIEVKF